MYEKWFVWLLSAAIVTVLFGANLVLVNLIGEEVFFRVDLTGRYSADEKSREIFAEVEGPVIARYIVSPGTLPKTGEYQALEQEVLDRLREYQRYFSKAELRIDTLDPTDGAEDIWTDVEKEQAALEIHPVTREIELEGRKKKYTFYSSLKVSYRGHDEIVNQIYDPRTVEYEFVAALQRLRQSDQPTIGVATIVSSEEGFLKGKVETRFSDMLRGRAVVRTVDLSAGPSTLAGIDVLFVVVRDRLSDEAKFEIDQFVMKGGHIVLCLDVFSWDRVRMGGQYNDQFMGWTIAHLEAEQFLEHLGVQFQPNMMFDLRNPIKRRIATNQGPKVLNLLAWEFEATADDLNPEFPVTREVEGVGFATPIALEPAPNAKDRGLEVDYLVRGSDASWSVDLVGFDLIGENWLLETLISPHAELTLKAWREKRAKDFGEGAPIRPILALRVEGVFESFFKEGAVPPGASSENYEIGEDLEVKDPGGRKVILKNPARNRLVVIGDSDWLVGVTERPANRDFLVNLTSWLAEDEFLSRLLEKSAPPRPLYDRNSKEEKAKFGSRKILYGALMMGVAPILVLALGIVKIVLRYQEKLLTEGTPTTTVEPDRPPPAQPPPTRSPEEGSR